MARKNTQRKKYVFTIILELAAMALVSCAHPAQGQDPGQEDATPSPQRIETGFELTGPDSFDSADTAILVDQDTQENTLTFLNLDLGNDIPFRWTAPQGWTISTGTPFPLTSWKKGILWTYGF